MKLDELFAILKPDQSVETIANSPLVYQQLDERYDNFRSHVLVSSHEFHADWSTWECHPAGDEIVVLLSGAASMALQLDAGEKLVELMQPGEYVVVPRGTWHTARISQATRMLFITPGEGTQNRDKA